MTEVEKEFHVLFPKGNMTSTAYVAPTDTQIGGSHYKDFKIQPAEYCQHNGFKFLESNAIKYISRHHKKNGKEDILKAIHCLELILELEYKT